MNATEERIKEMEYRISVMKAFQNGKKIQYRSAQDGGCAPTWVDLPNPSWKWDVGTYRVKPEPRRFFSNEYHDGILGGMYDSIEDAEKGLNPKMRRIHIVEFVEVLK